MSSKNQQSYVGQQAVVIGAGVAGLATATLLAREGLRVTVVDKLDVVGGRAANYLSPDAPGFRWDSGPSWYLMPEAFDHFYELCGTSTEEQLELQTLEPAYRVISEPTGDTPQAIDVSPASIIDTFDSIEPGSGQKLQRYLEKSSLVYGVAIQKFLYNNFARPHNLITRDVLPHVGLLAVLLSRSLQSYVRQVAKDYRLRQIMSYPAVFLSTEPKKAPALYSLMSHTDLIQGPRYPRGGFAAVVESFYRLALDNDVTFQLGTEVTEILTFGKKRQRVRGVRTKSGEILNADIVVSAADLKHTETQLLPPELQTYPAKYFETRDPGLSSILIYAGVKGALPELAHHTLMFSKDWDPDFRAVFGNDTALDKSWSQSIYISKTSATDTDVAPEGHENLFVLIPAAACPDMGHGSAYGEEEDPRVAQIAYRAIEQIGAWAGIENLSQRITTMKTVGPADFAQRYHAWDGGAIGPAHTLWQSAFFRGKNVSSKVDNLFYAGATTVPGVGVPLCLISAENIIKRLRQDHSSGPLPAL